jgi:hypothetical protein
VVPAADDFGELAGEAGDFLDSGPRSMTSKWRILTGCTCAIPSPMANIPAACQDLSNQVAALTKQYDGLAAQVAKEEGKQAWQGLVRLGDLRAQLQAAQQALATCVRINTAALSGVLDVMDATGDAAQGTQTVTLWDISGSTPVASDQTAVVGGAFGFTGPAPAQAALTVQTTGTAGSSLAGYDYRSGLLPSPLPAPQVRCEVVLCPALTVTPTELQSWASSFQAGPQQIGSSSSLISATVSFSTVTVTLAVGVITLNAVGTVSGTVIGHPLGQLPFSATVPFSLTPSGSPRAEDIVSFAFADAGPALLISAPGIGSSLVNEMITLGLPVITGQLQASIGGWLQQMIPQFVATALALPQLPASTTLTLRSLTIDQSGITVQPALGAVGTSLSTFQPTPLAS